jgi:exonuclease VII large subunit
MKPLQRGYSITYRKDGRVVRSYKEVRERQKVVVKLAEGQLDCAVEGRSFL